MATTYTGIGYPSAYDLNVKKPIDIRLVVPTIADRNLLPYTYATMVVSVEGPATVINGIATYPQISTWRCLVDKQPNFGGPTTNDQDWERVDFQTGNGSYKGPWNASTNAPDLTSAALKATLKPGDYYKVSVAGTTNLNGITTWAKNDSVFWDGSRWDRFENTNPQPVNPLYTDQEGPRFQTDVLNLIRLNALTEWVAGTAYGVNSYVKSSYQENGKSFVDTYVALAAMTAPTSALPTTTTPNPNWQLVTTTNGRKLGGTAQVGDTIGKAATGSHIPASTSPGFYLTPEEVDARIEQYGGSRNGAFLGGDAATFLTADPGEAPRN
jgi:hypothetical protein